MKRGKTITFGIFMIFIIMQQTQQQLVYTHLAGIKAYDKNTSQDNLQVNLGDDFEMTKQFSIYGWFKPNQPNPAISNIISLKNLKGSDSFLLRSFKDFPSCPFTQEKLQADENLRNLPEVIENPYCDFENINVGQQQDILYINYDLQPSENVVGQLEYSLTFLLANGYDEQTNQTNFILEAFTEIPKDNSWVFFGLSADYNNGSAVIYMQTDQKQFIQTKTFQVNYAEFELTKNAKLIVAGVENNPYFGSYTGFIGQIANIELSRFYVQNLSYQWAGYATLDSRKFNSVKLDFVYDVYDNNDAQIQSYGQLNRKFLQQGKFQLLYKLDSNRVGIRYSQNSQLQLGNDISFQQANKNIKSAIFYFDLQPSQLQTKDFVLLTRGELNQNGYIQISIAIENQQRFIRMIVVGEQGRQIFNAPPTLLKGQRNQFYVGISQGFDNSLMPLYADSNGGRMWQPLINNFPFDMSFQQITMFSINPEQSTPSNDYVDMFRFMILDSASPIINIFNKDLPNVQKIIQDRNNLQDKQCQFRSSVYENGVCYKCQNSIANLQYQCFPYCQEGFKNALNDVCIPCINNNSQCPELERTQFLLEANNDESFYIQPSRPILNTQIPYQRFQVKNIDTSNQQLNYNISPQVNQRALVQIDVNDDNESQRFAVIPYENPDNRLYDINRNLLLASGTVIPGTILGNLDNLNVIREPGENSYDCFVPSSRALKMRVLAYILLLAYAGTAFILLLMSCLFYKKFWALGGLWKFFLHHWMKLNLVAFLILLAIIMPCCVREFLHQLYRFVVSWDHELRHWINDANDNSTDYQNGFIQRRLPYQFRMEHVRPFILHNLLISFIVQLAIAFIYIILKIWDYFQTSGRSFMFYVLVFWEFTALIVGYLLFHMRDFVFSGLNWRKAIFSHSYFVCCFLIAIFYILVFILFWLYSLWRILFGGVNYWSDPIRVNKFYYFRAGYRDDRFARTYDHWMTLAHLVVGLVIGILIKQALAQMIIIVSVLVLLFGITILLRPWENIILLICDLLSQIAILVTVIFFLVFAILDRGSCVLCGDRDSTSCWIIVLFLFICLMLGLLGLLAAALMDCLQKNRIVREVEKEDFYHEDKQFVMQHGSSKMIYPVNQDLMEENNLQSRYGRDSVFTNTIQQQNQNSINIDQNLNRTVRDVKSVQPDEIEEDSMQNELFDVSNQQQERHRKSVFELAQNSKILNEQKNEFYSNLDHESKIISNQKYVKETKYVNH